MKWIFKLKLNSDGSVARHKARLVAKGFMQKAEVDYKEIFAPMTIIETIRLAMALASKRNWLVYHYVKYAFLNGSLNEDVYVTQPPGFEIKRKEKLVYKLNKALYGLKHAPRCWNQKINSFLIKHRFKQCTVEYGVYYKKRFDSS